MTSASKAKFGSLLFREFRIARKSIILTACVTLAFAAMIWFSLLSFFSAEIADDISLDSLIVTVVLFAAAPLFLDDIHISDVNSGWAVYSYALPITPLERAAVRFTRRLILCAGSCLFSAANAAAVCAYLGKAFSTAYTVWYVLVFSAALLMDLADSFFVLKARNGGDVKKMRTASGMASAAVMAVLVLTAFKASGIDLQALADDDAAISLPEFTAGALLWAVPLLLILIAADFFISYQSLRSAYPNAAKTKAGSKKDNGSEIKAVLPEKYAGAAGMLYKELAQNRLMLILTAAVPLLLTAFPFCFTAIGVIAGSQTVGDMFEMATNGFMRGLMLAMGIFIVSGIMSEVFKGDEKKLWAYFVVSTPKGVSGFMYNKYIVTLMMNLIYMTSGIFADNLLATVNYFVTGKELASGMGSFYLAGVFLLMTISALDIPFTVRYGMKKGSLVKTTVMLSLCAAATAVFSFLPDGAREKIMDAAAAVLDGNANGILPLVLSFCPYIAFGAFLFSYKVSCKLFMKGAGEYDK